LVIQYPAVHNGAVGAPAGSKNPYRKSGINGAYFGAIEEMDAAVGRLKEKLAQPTTDLLDQTLIFYTSDNGGVNRDAGLPNLTGNKRSSLEGGIRVGLVGFTGQAAQTAPVTLPPDFVMTGADLFPTIVDAGNVEVPSSGYLNTGALVDPGAWRLCLRRSGNLQRQPGSGGPAASRIRDPFEM
jgi:arylsulfatase A-like enzyme